MAETLLFCFFVCNSAYVLTLSLAGFFYKKLKVPKSTVFNRIAIPVPSYKEDNVIVRTTRNLLSLKYPGNFFDVVIIADSLKTETLTLFQSTNAIVMLDGVSEAINNHLFRQGSNVLGLSCSLIGSGMAFPFQLFKT